MTIDGVLLAEHDAIMAAYQEWVLECTPDMMYEAVFYINGINDFAQRLIETLEGKDGNSTDD